MRILMVARTIWRRIILQQSPLQLTLCRSGGMVDTLDSKSDVLHGRAGSSPACGTIILFRHKPYIYVLTIFILKNIIDKEISLC